MAPAFVPRREDPRMVRGEARYLADLRRPDTEAVLVIRSVEAHGHLRRVAFDGPPPTGVTLLDLDAFSSLPRQVPVLWTLGDQRQRHTFVADRHIRYQGQPVGLLIGADPTVLADAVESVVIEVDPLAVVATIDAATTESAPLLHPELASNVLARFAVGDERRAVDELFADCDRVIDHTFRIGRLAGVPMEPRGLHVDIGSGRVVVHTSTQSPHAVRDAIASVLGWSVDRIRVIAPEVGGGFGVKDHAHDDELMIVAASVLLGRNLRWVESRTESLTVTTQARDEIHRMRVGFDDDGRLRAMDTVSTRNAGAHFAIFGGGPLFSCLGMLPGPYRWEGVRGEGTLVATNQVPTAAYRGFGQTQATFLRERMVDLAARELAVDPVELRRMNMVTSLQQPFTTRTGITYDGGDYLESVERAAVAAASWAPSSDDGRRRGVGFATYVQMSGLGPSVVNEAIGLDIGGYETATVTMQHDGSVVIVVGTVPHGQGHETTFAQLVADRLGVPLTSIRLERSDTDLSPYSPYGTAASRSMAVGGAAIVGAADRVAEQLRVLAACRLEASASDIELVGGEAIVRGSGVGTGRVAIGELARWSWQGSGLPPGVEPGLVARRAYDPTSCTFGYGTHVCRVAVDPETGDVEIERYHVVQDCGTVINQTIVEGQTHGAIAQGAGAALLEDVQIDDRGQHRTATLLDYLIPGTGFLPPITIDQTATPSPHTPGGMKGIGEGGTNGAFAAVANAVAAALPEIADQLTDTPFTPQRLWELLH